MKASAMKVSTPKTSIVKFSKNLIIAAGLASAFFASSAKAALTDYDAAIANDNAGTLPYAAISTASVSFDTTSGAPFDFGAVSGSSTIEFIVGGDPVAQGRDGFLAVGANGTWNLRYEQWDDTGQLGFTHLGVADYLFDPPVATPVDPTHIAYRFDQTTETMDLYVGGVLAGSQSGPGYEMPAGAGFLGAKDADGAEGMQGVIDRVTVYNDAIAPSSILSHAQSFAIPEPSTFALLAFAVASLFFCRRRRY